MGVTGADDEVDGDVDVMVDETVEETGVDRTVDGVTLAVGDDENDAVTDGFADVNVVTVVVTAEP